MGTQGRWWARFVSPDHPIGRTAMWARARTELFAWRPDSDEDRRLKDAIGRLSPKYTMVAVDRLRQLAEHARDLHRRNVRGAVVECGTWRGGSLALLDWTFRSKGDQRVLYAFDSFVGLPQPGERDPIGAHEAYFDGWCRGSVQDVEAAVEAVGGTTERLHAVSGWLETTLPTAQTGDIALLNVDVDWYESVTSVLVCLFPRVVAGGIVNFDDYGRWKGCDEAVHDFLDAQRLPRTLLKATTRHGAWLRVPSTGDTPESDSP